MQHKGRALFTRALPNPHVNANISVEVDVEVDTQRRPAWHIAGRPDGAAANGVHLRPGGNGAPTREAFGH
ncbi:hypothetical protein QQZ08_008124 [Neonectria magnoliae]|uniref:Uncharacterized protein n=1 Tax=Neonectria magnoliae TaxID=2732573 RepID=A0ABR1HW45_9HYPO